jgi:hypothetical protein
VRRELQKVCVLVWLVAGCNYRPEPRVQVERAPRNWTVGIVRGPTLDSLREDPRCPNPRIIPQNIAFPQTDFVADPFLVREGKRWLLFFELFNVATGKGEIGLAESDTLCDWRFKGVVLREPFHLSYPAVMKVDKEHFMIPESRQAGAVRLYRATKFPTEWKFERELVRGNYSDATPLWFNSRWWLFANRAPYTLTIFSAPSLRSKFTEHPMSPRYEDDASLARPGGMPVVSNTKLIRFVQDNRGGYGKRVRALEVRALTTTSFEERPSAPDPLLEGDGSGWNSYGMHHISPVQLPDGSWVAAVDGNRE